VWREAVADDHICVTPATRDQARADNAHAAERRALNWSMAFRPAGTTMCRQFLAAGLWSCRSSGRPESKGRSRASTAVKTGRIACECRWPRGLLFRDKPFHCRVQRMFGLAILRPGGTLCDQCGCRPDREACGIKPFLHLAPGQGHRDRSARHVRAVREAPPPSTCGRCADSQGRCAQHAPSWPC
jgi:hypothetical protein